MKLLCSAKQSFEFDDLVLPLSASYLAEVSQKT